MAKITQPNLPADLPEDWNNSQYVSADGLVAGLTTKHGYNYLMEQVNAAQTAVNTLAEQAQTDLTSVEKQVGTLEQSVGGLEKGGFNATAQRTGTTVTITGPEDAVTVTFLAPADWTEGDSYTYNGQTITLTDLNGNPVKNGWKQGAPVTLSISGSTAYFAAGASGDFLPLSGGTMTGPAVGAPGAIAVPQFRNVQYGTEALTPGESPLPQGTLYITPEDGGAEPWSKVEFSNDYYELWESGKMRVLIPKRNYEKDVNPINSLIPNLEFFHSDDVLFNIPMGHYPSSLNPTSVAIAPKMNVWGEGFSYEAGTISLSTSEVRIRMYGMIIRPDENPSYKTMAYLPTIIYKSAF